MVIAMEGERTTGDILHRRNGRWVGKRRSEMVNRIVGGKLSLPDIMAEPPHNPEPLLEEDIFTLHNVPPEERRTGTPAFYRPPRQQRKTA